MKPIKDNVIPMINKRFLCSIEKQDILSGIM